MSDWITLPKAGGAADELTSSTDASVLLDTGNTETSSTLTVYHGVAAPTAGNEVLQVENNGVSAFGTSSNLLDVRRLNGSTGIVISPEDGAIFAKEGPLGVGIYSSDDYSYGPSYSEAYVTVSPAIVSCSTAYQGVQATTLNMQGSSGGSLISAVSGSASLSIEDPASGLQRVEAATSTTSARLREVDVGNDDTPIWDVRESTNVRFAVVRNGGLVVGRTATGVSANTNQETIVGVTSTAAARTITLDSSDCRAGRIVIIKDESGGAATNNITVDTEGAELIDGAASITITANYGVVRLYSNGTNWFSF